MSFPLQAARAHYGLLRKAKGILSLVMKRDKDESDGETPCAKRHMPSCLKGRILYQVYPRSFKDSTGDGLGDIKGVASKADYFKEIGVGIVWLSPIFKSPMVDFGYDISDFKEIDPIFGSMQDFEFLLQELHDRDIKLILDFVPNHTSDQHQWFQKSLKRNDPYTNYYVWADAKEFQDSNPVPPNNWLSVFRGSAWTWSEERHQFFYHQFLSKQPDLNFRCPEVKQEMTDIIKFWLEKGVDGFRLDAAKHLFEDELLRDEKPSGDPEVEHSTQYEYLEHSYTTNLPEVFDVLKEWRSLLNQYGERIMLAESYEKDTTIIMKYYGDEKTPLCDFPFNFNLFESLKSREALSGFEVKKAVDKWMDNLPSGKCANWGLSNHDTKRIATRLGGDLVDAMNMLCLLLPGTAVTYYGDEIGMDCFIVSYEDTQDPAGRNWGPDLYKKFSRDSQRTPMQWNDSKFAGFTTGRKPWLPLNPNYKRLNVEKQRKAKESHLKVYQNLARLRQKEQFLNGNLDFPFVSETVISFIRHYEEYSTYLIVINLSETETVVNFEKDSSYRLPESATICLRSSSDKRRATLPGNKVTLSNVSLIAGEGLVLELKEFNPDV